MPPRLYSRHSFVEQLDDGGEERRVFLSDREPFGYRDLPDNEPYVVQEGDRLNDLAARKYAALDDPPRFYADQLWFVIADFQPSPIHDPTIALVAGQQLILPSTKTVLDQILNAEFRRRVTNG